MPFVMGMMTLWMKAWPKMHDGADASHYSLI